MSLLAVSLGCSFALTAAEPASGYKPMKVLQTEPVIFPNRAQEVGFLNGEARIAIQIDENGTLSDYLLTAYSHPAFGDTAVQAVKRWKYEPAVLNGVAHGAIVELTFLFENRGIVVVDMTVSSYVEMRNVQLRPHAFAYSACHLRDLDRIPTPVKVVRPLYPADQAKAKEAGTVTVSFYIDEKGHVRMPAVDREANEAFAAAAVQAVSQWEFEPPMSKGHPVLVAARQDFNFRPGP